jgi:hypothetical protein
MTERAYRFILGFGIILFLFLQWDFAMYATLAVLGFEAATNWRVPILVSRIRYATDGYQVADSDNPDSRFDYDAERMLRWIVAAFCFLGYIAFSQQLWFFPWFVALSLVLAGVTGIWPMVMLLRKLGLK